MNWKLVYAILASVLIHCFTIIIYPHINPTVLPIEEYVTMVKLIGEIPTYDVESDYKSKLENLVKEISMNMQGQREKSLFDKMQNTTPLIKLPQKKNLEQNPKDILPMDIPYSRPDPEFKNNNQISGEKDFIDKNAFKDDRSRFDSLLEGEVIKSNPTALPYDLKIEHSKGEKKLSFIKEKFVIEDLQEEEKIMDSKIEWEGTPRALLYSPEFKTSYQGDIEGKIQFRFWVDKSGTVIKAAPLKKLSPKLEEEALNYIVYNRFEASDKYEIQEGIITINFMLN